MNRGLDIDIPAFPIDTFVCTGNMDRFFQVKGFIEKNDGTVFNGSFKRVSIDKEVVIFAGFAKDTEGDEFIVIDPEIIPSQEMSSGVVKKEIQKIYIG